MLTLNQAGMIQRDYNHAMVPITERQRDLLRAVLEEPFPKTHPRCLLYLIRAYIAMIEKRGPTLEMPALHRDFGEKELVYFAVSIGWPMKPDYRERLAILNGGGKQNQQGITTPEPEPPASKEEAKGLNIAGAIGAKSWAEIELQMGARGIRARCAGADKWYPVRGWIEWDKLKMQPSDETRYFKIFTAIAAAGGAIPREGKTDYNSAVHDLNTKMRAAFGLNGQAFKTEGVITTSNLAAMSVK